MVNEETTNELIRTLLKEAKITPTAQGTNDKIIAKTLKDASKKDTGKKGAPDLVAFSNSFPLIFENKKDIKDQAEYLNESKTKLKEDTTSKGQYAENGALHYAKHIVNHKDYIPEEYLQLVIMQRISPSIMYKSMALLVWVGYSVMMQIISRLLIHI